MSVIVALHQCDLPLKINISFNGCDWVTSRSDVRMVTNDYENQLCHTTHVHAQAFRIIMALATLERAPTWKPAATYWPWCSRYSPASSGGAVHSSYTDQRNISSSTGLLLQTQLRTSSFFLVPLHRATSRDGRLYVIRLVEELLRPVTPSSSCRIGSLPITYQKQKQKKACLVIARKGGRYAVWHCSNKKEVSESIESRHRRWLPATFESSQVKCVALGHFSQWTAHLSTST